MVVKFTTDDILLIKAQVLQLVHGLLHATRLLVVCLSMQGTTRDEFGRLVLGDIIVGVNGTPVRNSSDLYRILDKCMVSGTCILNMCMVRGMHESRW